MRQNATQNIQVVMMRYNMIQYDTTQYISNTKIQYNMILLPVDTDINFLSVGRNLPKT